MSIAHGIEPIGYRFEPTERQLVMHFLMNKVYRRPLQSHQFIYDIDAIEFYAKSPRNLVSRDPDRIREWYFFVNGDEYFHGEMKQIRLVGDGIGFWRSIGEEDPIYNSGDDDPIYDPGEDDLGFKIYYTYFSGTSPNVKKTHWRMEAYRLPYKSETELQIDKWVLVKLKRGQHY